jgi:small subunit ribosomal protein S18
MKNISEKQNTDETTINNNVVVDTNDDIKKDSDDITTADNVTTMIDSEEISIGSEATTDKTSNNTTSDNNRNNTDGQVAPNNAREHLIPNTVLFNKIPTSGQKTQRCPLCIKTAPELDYKNVDCLQKFISEKGRILPARLTGVCRKHQRKLTRAIKLARTIGLLPIASSHN